MGHYNHSKSTAERPQSGHGQPPHSGAEPDSCLEAVLETECMALLALEASRARMRFLPGDHGRGEAAIVGAIDLLRDAIAELRARLGGGAPSLLSFGFVARHEDLERPDIPGAGF